MTTQHTIQPLEPGDPRTCTVNHDDYTAVQFDFYIPAAVWSHSATRIFLDRLKNLAKGATIFKGMVGVWQDEEEDTNIFRMILRRDKFDPDNIRRCLHSEVGDLFAKLSTSTESSQKAVMFTETVICVTMAKKPAREPRYAD